MNKVINLSEKDVLKLKLNISGENNIIFFGRNVFFDNLTININSSYNKIIICNGVRLSGNIIMKISDNNKLFINKNTSIGGANFIIGESSSVFIGHNCMISWGIEFRTTDSHAIYDISSKKRINCAKDIIINNNVWISAKSSLLKGSYVNTGSVVGYGSVVKRKFIEKNIIIAGNPARKVKENIFWDPKLLG